MSPKPSFLTSLTHKLWTSFTVTASAAMGGTVSTQSHQTIPRRTPQAQEPQERYRPGGYHPVAVGDRFQSRYCVVGKLGWGQHSTVWLARDLTTRRHVALKVMTARSSGASREVDLLQRVRTAEPEHSGRGYVVQMLDNFRHRGPHGLHTCLVLELMGPSVQDWLRHNKNRRLPIAHVKGVAKYILRALHYLHQTCGIIHTDIKPDNIFLSIDNIQSLIDSKLTGVPTTQVPPGPLNDYESREISRPFNCILDSLDTSTIVFKLGDLGHGNWINERFTDIIQSPALRAPEVVIGANWDESADMWSVGCVIYEFLTGRNMFKPSFQTEEFGFTPEESHLIQIIELFGHLPNDMLATGKRSRKWFDESGQMLAVTNLFPVTLEQLLASRGLDATEVPVVASFLKTMLQLRPKHRLTALEVLDHPWLVEADD